MWSAVVAVVASLLLSGPIQAFVTPSVGGCGSSISVPACSRSVPTPTTTMMAMMGPTEMEAMASLLTVAAEEAAESDNSEVIKTVLITLTLGGGLIPALISANSAMFRNLAGGRRTEDDEEAIANLKPGESFDPTIKETKYRKFVESSGASGPVLPYSQLLLASAQVPLADIVAILGRIKDVNTLADWKNLPSTKLPGTSEKNPPMWLPRKAFKVAIRKAKFLGWPTDPKTGGPVGGEELKAAEFDRIRKPDALISDAALDVVFDSFALGAGIVTPDKVENTLGMFLKGPNEVDLGEFIGAALRGRSTTLIAAFTFILIQYITLGSLFVAPALRRFAGIDIGLGTL